LPDGSDEPDSPFDAGTSSCTTACALGQSCVGAVCQCLPGLVPDGAECIDPAHDPLNCGPGRLDCNPDRYCVAGLCACRPGLTPESEDPDAVCLALSADHDNCGVVGRVCMNNESCWSGACIMATCPADSTECGARDEHYCARLGSDPLNCGTCDHVCARDQVCVSGSCRRFVPALGECGCPGSYKCCVYPGDAFNICVDDSVCPSV